MDVLTSESLGALVKRPNLAGGKPNLVVVEPTKALEAYMKGELSRRIEASKAWKPSPGQMSNPRSDRVDHHGRTVLPPSIRGSLAQN